MSDKVAKKQASPAREPLTRARVVPFPRKRNLDYALSYASKHGWPVFPLWWIDGDQCGCGNPQCRDPGKHPLGKLVPHGFKNAICDRATIKQWWGRYPNAGIAVATGRVSGLVVLDVDVKKGKQGLRSYSNLDREVGPIPATRTACTPSDGRHFYFQHVDGIGCAGEFLPGLDLKGDAGYVVAPPSHGNYRWVTSKPGEVDPVQPMPEGLALHLKSVCARPQQGKATDETGDVQLVAAALAVIPNEDLSWDAWSRIGLATYRATNGCSAGFDAFDEWSRKSSKYDAATTRQRWEEISRSPPQVIGIGTLIYLADLASPGWRPTTASDSFTWDEPDWSLLDDRRGELPAFPLDVLKPEGLRNWIERAAHGTGTTVDHVAVPFLGITSSLIGTARRVQPSRSWSEPVTIWTSVVGPSGSGKTPGLDASRKPLALLEADREADIADMKRQHDEDLQRAQAAMTVWKEQIKEATRKGKPTPPKPEGADVPLEFVEPRLYTSDVTIEKMGVLLTARPSGMLLLTDELSGWFANMSRYSGGDDKSFWLEAWDGRPRVVERMGRASTRLPHLLIGVVGGLQPDKLAEAFQGAVDGMHARFLFAWPQPAPYRPLSDAIDEIEPDVVKLFDKLSGLVKTRIAYIPLSGKAKNAFEEFRKEVYETKEALYSREREWLVKGPAEVLRLAGTLAYLRRNFGQPGDRVVEPKDIRCEDIDAAVTLRATISGRTHALHSG
jgi:hypothetical protein